MFTVSMMLLATACISSPTDPAEQTETPGAGTGELAVAPSSVWLSQGGSRALTARLVGDGTEVDSITFTWSSSNPGVVDVDQDGVVRATGQGTAKINVAGGGRRKDAAVTVTVASDEQEARIAAILNMPRLESVWPQLAFSKRYDELFHKYGDLHFSQSGGDWEMTYYDRQLAWYAGWWRTGDAELVERGNVDVVAYRDDYVMPNNAHVPPRWVLVEGLAVHYLLTGDARSLEAIEMMADDLAQAGWLENMMETRYRDGRIQGRAILAQIIAYELTGNQKYRDRAATGLDGLMEWYASSGANGSWDHPTRTDISYCGGMATFQITHGILEAMVRYYDLIESDPRILPVLEKTLDYSWSFWVPGEGFAYIQPPETFSGGVFHCEGSGSSRPSADLSLLILPTFGDAYRLTGAERFRVRGDEVLEFGLSGAIYLNGYKQFNESFMRSYRYLYFTG